MIYLDYLIKIGLSLLLSAIVGYERDQQNKNAGLRTTMLISLGATVFTLIPFLLLPISKELNFTYDFSRIIAYIIPGIGFLVGIIIINNKKNVEGVTTSACLWTTVGIGILCGIGELVIASFVALSVFLILKIKYVTIKFKQRGVKRCRRKKPKSSK